MEEEPKMYREQLVTLLTKYKPDQLRKVDEMLLKYAGREEALLMALRERYNIPEPLPVREMCTLIKEKDNNESNRELSKDSKTKDDEHSSLLTEKMSKENLEQIHSPRSLQTPLSSVSLSTSNVNFNDNRNQQINSAPRDYRQELIDLYTQYDAAHLYKVDQYLNKYKGREAAMVAAVRKKLCATSVASVSASHDNETDKESVDDKETQHERSEESAIPTIPINATKQQSNDNTELRSMTNAKDSQTVTERAISETRLNKGNAEDKPKQEQSNTVIEIKSNDALQIESADTIDDNVKQGDIQESTNTESKEVHNVVEELEEENENDVYGNMYDDNKVEDIEPVNKNSEEEQEIMTENITENVRENAIHSNNSDSNKSGNADKVLIEEPLKQTQNKSHNEQSLLNNNNEVNDKLAAVSNENKLTELVRPSQNVNKAENIINNVINLHPDFPVIPAAQKQAVNSLFAGTNDNKNENTPNDKPIMRKEEKLEQLEKETCVTEPSAAKNTKINISGISFTLLEQYFTSLGVMQINQLPHIDRLCGSYLLENLINESEEKENEKTCSEVISELHLPAFVTFRHFCQAVNLMRKEFALPASDIVNNIKRFLCDVSKMNTRLHHNAMQRENNKQNTNKDNSMLTHTSATQANVFASSQGRTKPASLSTSIAVIHNRHKCISEEIFAIRDLQYGFTVYRSIRPSVSESWVQCWGTVTDDARLTCTTPRSNNVEIIIPFEHIVSCKLQSFVAHSYYSSSSSGSNNVVISDHVRYSTLPPSMAKNGVCITLTRDAVPLQLWLCTSSMFISQAIVRCYRVWQREQVQFRNIKSIASRNNNKNVYETANSPQNRKEDENNGNIRITISSNAKKNSCNDKKETAIDDEVEEDVAIREGFAFANTPLHQRHPMTDQTQSIVHSCNKIAGAKNTRASQLSSYGSKMFTVEDRINAKIGLSDELELSALHVWAACGGSGQFQHEKWSIYGSHLLFEIVNDTDADTSGTNNRKEKMRTNSSHNVANSSTEKTNNTTELTSTVYVWSLHDIDDIIYNDTSPISATKRSSTAPLTSMLKLSFHHAALSMIRKPLSFHTRQTSVNYANNVGNTFSLNYTDKVNHQDNYDTIQERMKDKASSTRSTNDACYLVIRCKLGYTLFCACATLAERSELVQWLSHALIRIALHIASPEPMEMHLPHRTPGTLRTSREHTSGQE